jgi:preprotein translocase subunit SecE
MQVSKTFGQGSNPCARANTNKQKRWPKSQQLRYMSKIGNYIQNAYDELLHKVTWPTWGELQQTTGIVLFCILLLTLIVFIMDAASQNLFKIIYSIIA